MARGTVGWNRKTGLVEWIPGDDDAVAPGRMARAGAVVLGLLVTVGYLGEIVLALYLFGFGNR